MGYTQADVKRMEMKDEVQGEAVRSTMSCAQSNTLQALCMLVFKGYKGVYDVTTWG